jgi:hypothetical protein
LPEPAGLLGLKPSAGPEYQRLEAVYFDTSDLRMLQSGVTLRRREGGLDEGWHLKLPADATLLSAVRAATTTAKS